MAPVVRRVDNEPRLKDFWDRRFPFDKGWESRPCRAAVDTRGTESPVKRSIVRTSLHAEGPGAWSCVMAAAGGGACRLAGVRCPMLGR